LNENGKQEPTYTPIAIHKRVDRLELVVHQEGLDEGIVHPVRMQVLLEIIQLSGEPRRG